MRRRPEKPTICSAPPRSPSRHPCPRGRRSTGLNVRKCQAESGSGANNGPSLADAPRFRQRGSREVAKPRNEVWGLRLRVGDSQHRHDPANKAPPPPDLVSLRQGSADGLQSCADRSEIRLSLVGRRLTEAFPLMEVASLRPRRDLRSRPCRRSWWSEHARTRGAALSSKKNVGRAVMPANSRGFIV